MTGKWFCYQYIFKRNDFLSFREIFFIWTQLFTILIMTWFFCFLKNRAVLYIYIFTFAFLITFKGKHFNYFYFYTFTYFMYKLFIFRPLYLFLGQQKSNGSVPEVLASSTNFYCWSEIYNSAFLQGFLTLVHISLYRNVH